MSMPGQRSVTAGELDRSSGPTNTTALLQCVPSAVEVSADVSSNASSSEPLVSRKSAITAFHRLKRRQKWLSGPGEALIHCQNCINIPQELPLGKNGFASAVPCHNSRAITTYIHVYLVQHHRPLSFGWQASRWSLYRPMEIKGGKVLMWDTTCSDTLQAHSYTNLATTEAGAVAEEAERKKRAPTPTSKSFFRDLGWRLMDSTSELQSESCYGGAAWQYRSHSRSLPMLTSSESLFFPSCFVYHCCSCIGFFVFFLLLFALP